MTPPTSSNTSTKSASAARNSYTSNCDLSQIFKAKPCRTKLGGICDKAFQFTNALFWCESQVFECEREIYTELSGTRGRGTGRWVEEVVFNVSAHTV